MFIEYIEKLRASGQRHFSSQQIMRDLNLSSDATRAGLYRLKKNGKLISPVNGLYVIVPPEHRSYGCIPAEELIPIMMTYINVEYYVALLSAAAFYGASHQKPMVFQVVTNRQIKHSLTFGLIHIQLIYKKTLARLPIKNFVVSTGYLKVATPELIAIDLLKFLKHAGGMNNIATVLSDLIENIDVHKLIKLAESIDERYQLQRLGYIFEKIEVMDDHIKNAIIRVLAEYVFLHARSYTPLASNLSRVGYARCRKWKIIENTDFEAD